MYLENTRRTYEASSISMLVTGTLLLLIASMFLIAGAQNNISGDDKKVNEIVMNIVISSASSGLLQVAFNQKHNVSHNKKYTASDDSAQVYHYNITALCNSIIAGLVSVTASSQNIELWAAAIIGVVGSIIYTNTKMITWRNEIDDPMGITEVHGICGIWSLVAVGLFDIEKGMLYTGDPNQMLIQLLGITAYVVWAAILSFLFFWSLKINDNLRVNPIYEIIGLDFDQKD